jgi:hypothetical protein
LERAANVRKAQRITIGYNPCDLLPSDLGTHTLVQLTGRKLFSFSVPFHRKLLSIFSSHINFFNDMGLAFSYILEYLTQTLQKHAKTDSLLVESLNHVIRLSEPLIQLVPWLRLSSKKED